MKHNSPYNCVFFCCGGDTDCMRPGHKYPKTHSPESDRQSEPKRLFPNLRRLNVNRPLRFRDWEIVGTSSGAFWSQLGCRRPYGGRASFGAYPRSPRVTTYAPPPFSSSCLPPASSGKPPSPPQRQQVKHILLASSSVPWLLNSIYAITKFVTQFNVKSNVHIEINWIVIYPFQPHPSIFFFIRLSSQGSRAMLEPIPDEIGQ